MRHSQRLPRGARVTLNGNPRPDQRRSYRYRYLYTTEADDGRLFHHVDLHRYENHTHVHDIMFPADMSELQVLPTAGMPEPF